MAAMRRGGGVLAALLAVLMLLAVPALSGRAHAVMPSMGMGGMAMASMDMPMTPMSEAAPSLHHGADEAICMVACSLAGQLLPASLPAPSLRRQADAPVRYFTDARRLAGVSGEPGSPPPR